MHNTFKRTIIFISLSVGLFLAAFLILSYTLFKHSNKLTGWIAHTNLVINRIEAVNTDLAQVRIAHAAPGSASAEHVALEQKLLNDVPALISAGGYDRKEHRQPVVYSIK